ncbi:MAG TPA: penicillin-binding transpeptidase domain-containing protein [Thermoanaerobaculia bacterium]|nr:penicillin-binding transpeptidase domain-containing protein [Thermoanaerobaculia bacterium]
MKRVALLVIVVALAALGAVSIPIIEARNAWRRGNDAEAMAIAQRWSWLPFPLLDKTEVAQRLFSRERYADFLAYDAVIRDSHDPPQVLLYRAAAYAATEQIPKADATLQAIDARTPKYNVLRAAIEERKGGAASYVFDRAGRVIGMYRDHAVVATDPDFAPLVEAKGGALTFGARVAEIGPNATIDTTLDPFVQKAALAALGNYRGSLVAIDPRTNEVLAIANSGPGTNRAFENEYEPGSVVKVLTGLNALSGAANVDAMFPYVCNGVLMIDGRRFVDWVPQGHGKLNSFEDALAVSCNVFFADLGLHLGRDRLERSMRSAGFDAQANLGIFQVPLGKTVGRVFDNFETAFFAIGLEHEEINAIHLAMLASMVANRGVLTTPRLLRQRRSILGDVVMTAPPQGRTRIATAAAAERMIHAMQAVATQPRGTGRRAPVEGLSLAMKTGTSGDRKAGLEALIMAFSPVDNPKIAFGVIAEGAGPAEYAGAKIAHDFLERMRGALQ